MTCPHCGSFHPTEAGVCPATGMPMAARRPAALSAGDLLEGKYQIVGEIGRGAMGVVYEALHVALGKRVAIKTVLDEMGADAQLGARFEREARAASAIGHPHIVDVFDLGCTRDGLLFMVMELLDGESLAALLKRTPLLPIPLATHLMVQVLGGLFAAHKHGIVHRDLKPENIFVLQSDERPNFVKILDFGISKVLGPQSPGKSATVKGSGTMVGSILGTPLYMSPEQAIGQVAIIDHRADIYSAGVVLYEMLCGRTPFAGEGYAQILVGLLDGNYPPPRSLRPDIPPALEAAIVRALDRDIERRFPSAAAMREAISGGPVEVTPSPLAFSASVGDPLHISLAGLSGLDDRPVQVSAAIALVEEPTSPTPSDRRRGKIGIDPFAPPPGSETSPLLADDLDRPPSLRQSTDGRAPVEPKPREIAVVEHARPVFASRGGTLAPDRLFSMRTRSRLVKALLLLALAVCLRIGYSFLRPGSESSLPFRQGGTQKVLLTVLPSQASVQIDHVPTTQRELSLSSGAEHILNAASPGRMTRRFAFVAKPGLALSVVLGHALPLPSPTDPPPLPAELTADYPDDARSQAEIEHAFAKLDRYNDCLVMAGDAGSDGKRGGNRARLRGEEYALCRRLVSEAASAEPAMPELQLAAESYLGSSQNGQKLDVVGKMAVSFRAEFLAARAAWQLEELSRLGKEDGQKAAWHLRRVALAVLAWLRALKAGPGPVADERLAKLGEYHQALLDFAEGARQEIARVAGSSDFMQAAENALSLARGQANRKPSEFAALDACRRVVAAFNALVLE